MLFVILLLGGGLMLISLVMCSHYLFKYLMVLESYKVLLLLICLLVKVQDCQVVFISMMALFVLEASMMLIVVGMSMCHGSLRVSGGL